MEDSKVSKITEQANDSQHIDFDCQDAMPLYDFFVNIGKRVVSFVEASEKSFNLLHQYGIPFFSFLNQLGQQLIDALSNLDIPTDEERLQLIERSIKWGQCGWTFIPSMPLDMLKNLPDTAEEANKLAIQYCSNEEIEKLFTSMEKQNLNKSDLQSAIFCYRNKQYKACALLMCSIIDSKLIRLSKEDNRPVGERAVKKLKAKFVDSGEKILIEAMFVYNLLAYLETLFAKAGGFKNEPETLNRNYIGHGMNLRPVRKRDCIQLFLALYNLTQFLQIGC